MSNKYMKAADLCARHHKCDIYNLGMTARIESCKKLNMSTESFIDYLIKKINFKAMIFVYMHIDNWIELTKESFEGKHENEFAGLELRLKEHFKEYQRVKPGTDATEGGFFRIAIKEVSDNYAGFIIMVSRFAEKNAFYLHKGVGN